MILNLSRKFWKNIEAERSRWLLWLPVAFGAGIIVYFALPNEPKPWAGGVFSFLSAVLFLRTIRRDSLPIRTMGILLLFVALGFWGAQLRTERVAGPVLGFETRPVMVTGTIAEIHPLPKARRIVVEDVKADTLKPEITPRKVRLHSYHVDESWQVGDRIKVRAILRPPPPPVAPDAFDFQRYSFFKGIGSIGFTLGKPTLLDRPEQLGFWYWVESVRLSVARTVTDSIDDPNTAAVAAALMTGIRTGIPERALNAFRDSGLAHLLAISGLHMGLIAGLIFAGIRIVFCAFPSVALRWPVKKIAAGVALFGAFCYLLLAGAPIPTQRAFLMVGIVFVGVFVNRQAISLRLVALAAMVILIMMPEVILTPSFQMSFAAVIALVATYEAIRPHIYAFSDRASWQRKAVLYVVLIMLTTIVSEIATISLGIHHFNRITLYNLVANIVAMPLVVFVIMPAIIVAFILMPFGLAHWPLWIVDVGLYAIVEMGDYLIHLPRALILVPALPGWGLLIVMAGGLWLCLWQRRWRLLGIIPLIGGGFSILANPVPSVLVSPTAELVALKTETNIIMTSKTKEKFVSESWLGQLAETDMLTFDDNEAAEVSCDPLACIYTLGSHRIVYAKDYQGLGEDCNTADVIITSLYNDGTCLKAADSQLIIDKAFVRKYGATALYHRNGVLRLKTVADSRGHRPWIPR